MKKKNLILIGSFCSTIAPLAVVSCSTSWTKWSKSNVGETKTKFIREFAPDNLWKVRPINDIKAAAWNASTKTLDISKVNNHFELLILLADILKLTSVKAIDEYWNDFAGMKTYLSNITKKIDINVVDGSKTSVIKWDVANFVTSAIAGIDSYSTASDKAFDVEANGLQGDIPKDFSQVAIVGAPLTSNSTVSALLSRDNIFALKLSKLVNLPKATFDGFASLMTKIDMFLDTLWASIKDGDWLANIDLSVSGVNGKIGDSPKTDIEKKNIIKGQFIISALKH